MMHLPRLAIIAGTGRKVGKTTVACRIIERFSRYSIIAVKITCHFHEPQEHLRLIRRESDFVVWEEMSKSEPKDSSRMLASGAIRSFYIQAEKGVSGRAFSSLLEVIPADSMIVCESPSLGKHVMPGALIIVTCDESDETGIIVPGKRKDLFLPEGKNSYTIKTSEVLQGMTIPLTIDKTGFTFK